MDECKPLVRGGSESGREFFLQPTSPEAVQPCATSPGCAPYTPRTPLIHPSHTTHTPLIHPSHTSHTPLMHPSHTPHTPLMHPSYTPHTPSYPSYISQTPLISPETSSPHNPLIPPSYSPHIPFTARYIKMTCRVYLSVGSGQCRNYGVKSRSTNHDCPFNEKSRRATRRQSAVS